MTPHHKDSYPWITTEIGKLIQKRDKNYRKMKTGTEELKAAVKALEREICTKLCHSYWRYMSVMFTSSHSEEDKTQPEKILDIHQTSMLYFSWRPSTKSQWTT